MRKNLVAEMARARVTRIDLGALIDKNPKTVGEKIKGNYEFSLGEAQSIRDKYFPGLALEYLFANTPEDGAEQRTQSP